MIIIINEQTARHCESGWLLCSRPECSGMP